jgi:hypothetical protein
VAIRYVLARWGKWHAHRQRPRASSGSPLHLHLHLHLHLRLHSIPRRMAAEAAARVGVDVEGQAVGVLVGLLDLEGQCRRAWQCRWRGGCWGLGGGGAACCSSRGWRSTGEPRAGMARAPRSRDTPRACAPVGLRSPEGWLELELPRCKLQGRSRSQMH